MALLDIMPMPRLRVFLVSGAPAAGALLYTYAAGGSVPQTTYHDALAALPHDNPIVADSTGLFTGIFLQNLPYRMVCLTSDAGTTIFDQDNVWGANYAALLDSNFILKNTTDPTRKLQLALSGITTATTRLWTVPDVSGIPVLNASNPLMTTAFRRGQGANIAAANDLTLGTDGDYFNITGNTQINRIAPTGRNYCVLCFTGTPTVKHGQATGGGFNIIKLNGSADLVAAADTILELALISSVWQEISRKVA